MSQKYEYTVVQQQYGEGKDQLVVRRASDSYESGVIAHSHSHAHDIVASMNWVQRIIDAPDTHEALKIVDEIRLNK